MVIEVALWLIFIIVVIAFAIVVASIATSIRAKLTGRYLNRYFIVSHKKGVYFLHHSPVLGFYCVGGLKYGRLMKDAIERFRATYPDMPLVGTTNTLHPKNRKCDPMDIKGLRLIFFRLLTDIVILLNLANWSKGMRCLVRLIRNNHKRVPRRYVILEKGVLL